MPTPDQTRPSRDPGLDAVRGFLILCVVAGHLPLGNFLGMQPGWWGWLNETLYLFHVPLFFALACLLGPARDWPHLVRGILLILVPYVLWFAWQQRPVLLQHPLVWLRWLGRGNFDALQSILWFLPALVSVRLLAPILHKTLDRPAWLVAGVGLWLGIFANLNWLVTRHTAIPFGIDVALLCLPYFVVVLAAERHRVHLAQITPAAWLILAVGLGFWIYETEPLKTHTPWHKRIDLAQLSIPHTLGAYLAWVLLGVSWLMTFRRVTWPPLVLLGRHSLPIFLLHYEVFKWFLVQPERLPGGPGPLALTVVVVLSVAMPVGLSLAARRLWPGARWLGL